MSRARKGQAQILRGAYSEGEQRIGGRRKERSKRLERDTETDKWQERQGTKDLQGQ